jgi:hypothetical protein
MAVHVDIGALQPLFRGGGTLALNGRRDGCRHNAFAAVSRVTANRANVNWNRHDKNVLPFNFTPVPAG